MSVIKNREMVDNVIISFQCKVENTVNSLNNALVHGHLSAIEGVSFAEGFCLFLSI